MASIVKLPESTISKIAAGEIVTRPVNVIKELLENSLDAGSSNIRITIDQGGLRLIEIIDNGHGIARADAELLCRRHATSKLATASDLTRISTFGFRGEALASISEMAEIQVKTFNMKSDKKGWRANYKGGQLLEKPIDTYLQFPGTQFRVTNLFSSMKQRRASLQASFIEEKKAVSDLVMRYAIHHRDTTTISLKESNCPDLICLLAPMSLKPCIGMFFGLDMENNLFEFDVENSEKFKLQSHIAISYKKSATSYNQSNCILFVNGRLVECNELKKEVEAQIFEHLSSKQYTLLVIISIRVPKFDVDVNMHPAKATVALHYQSEIIALIILKLKDTLKRELGTQTVPLCASQKSIGQLTMSSQNSQLSLTRPENASPVRRERLNILAPGSMKNSPFTTPVQNLPAKRQFDLIHNDSSQRSLKHFCPIHRLSPRDVKLMSITDLRRQVVREKSNDCAKTIKNSTFVGLFDHNRALIQHETKLFAINFQAYLKEQYYQFYLFDFGNFPPIEILPPGNKIQFIIETYLEDLRKHDKDAFTSLKFNTTELVITELLKHSDMFSDYLTLKITRVEILTIPCIVPDEVPNLIFLGKFLVRLVNEVDYTEERNCFRTIGRVIADFYSQPPANMKDRDVHRNYHDHVKTKLYVAIKDYLVIPDWLFAKENICQISDTKDLYKVFERC